MRCLAITSMLSTAVLMGACTVTRTGTLQPIPTGKPIPVEVSVTSEEAFVRGVVPASGEKLEGALPLDRESRRGALTPPRGQAPVGGGGSIGTAGTGVPVIRDTVLNFLGTLEGDQGTLLNCTLQVEKRVRLSGSGTCRQIVDGREVVYRLVF